MAIIISDTVETLLIDWQEKDDSMTREQYATNLEFLLKSRKENPWAKQRTWTHE